MEPKLQELLPRMLFRVTDAFEMKWGLTLVPGVTTADAHFIRSGYAVELRLPDGGNLHATVAFLPMPGHSDSHPITLREAFGKNDVPSGTEVWLLGKNEGEH